MEAPTPTYKFSILEFGIGVGGQYHGHDCVQDKRIGWPHIQEYCYPLRT